MNKSTPPSSSINPANTGDLHFAPCTWYAEDEKFRLTINASLQCKAGTTLITYIWTVLERGTNGRHERGVVDSFGEAVRAANSMRVALASAPVQTIGKWTRRPYGEIWFCPFFTDDGREIVAEVSVFTSTDGARDGTWEWDVEGACGTAGSREKAMARAERVAEAMVETE